MTDSDFVVSQRNVSGDRVRTGWLVGVTGLDFEHATDHYVPKKPLGTYALRFLDESIADHVEGEIPDVDGTPVVHIGDNFAKNFHTSHDSDPIPVDVLEWMDDNDLVLVRGVDGGWLSWEGRPEWSDSEADLSDAEAVDMAAEIVERREAGDE